MVNLERVRVHWSGTTGGNGLSTFYTTNGATAHVALANWFAAIKSFVPNTIVFSVDNGGDTIDPLTGTLMGSWGASTTGPISATGTGNYALASGMLVKWDTGTIVHGHRLIGKTYIVPLVDSAFNTLGAVSASVQATVQSAAASCITAAGGSMVVWNRPKGSVAGGFSAVTTASVVNKGVILRSRRD